MTNTQDIEKEIKRKEADVRKLFNKGCVEYSLLEDGDKILIALSGGKDSLELVRLLGQRAKIFKPSIRVEAAHVVMDNIHYESDCQYLAEFCQQQGVKLSVIHASFDESTDKRKTPCFLCSWNRRKALFEYAKNNGFNKIALGHHNDDILTTMLMNLTYEGAFSTMTPKMQLEHYPVTLIRPLCLVRESMIAELAELLEFKKQKKNCPYEDTTRRKSMQQVFNTLEQLNPEARYSMWHALKGMMLVVALILCVGVSAQKQQSVKRLAERVAQSEMTRHPQAWTLDGQKVPKWNYTQGLELYAMRGCITDEEWVQYAKTYVDELINENGVIKGYKMSDYKLDAINSSRALIELYQLTGEERYMTAIRTLRQQLNSQPRTPEGGFWHKTIYPEQMWLDGQYMALPFLAQYTLDYEDNKDLTEVWRQLKLVYEHTYCDKCHLCHHAWDSARKQPWADSQTGRSAHAWGRAEGWFMMALVDIVEIIDQRGMRSTEHEGVQIVAAMLQTLGSRLLQLQNPTDGTWQQVLDKTGAEGNYQEMTCSAMFAYSFMKAHRLGLLSKRYAKAGRKALDGICTHYLKEDAEGLVSLTNCCAVAGLSDTRNGSYEYYLSEPVIDNDPKGIGPLLMAMKEMQRNIHK